MILDAKVPKEALSSLVAFRTSTAPLDPELADQFHKHFGIPVLQTCGATEFAGGDADWTLPDFLRSGEQLRGRVGKMTPDVEGRIVDAESGEHLHDGDTELLKLRPHNLGD